jgi:predicted transglutaminase-like cysteine proteinase
MRKFLSVAALPFIALLQAAPVAADPAQNAAQDAKSAAMRVFGPTQPPHGWIAFCARTPVECQDGKFEDSRFQLTSQRRAELERINLAVNKEVIATTDKDLYGVNEFWTLPGTHGDCEDYALLKRQRLIRAGWPAGALLMTVVYDEKGEGHAVLTARTSQGDFVLDNKVDEIKLWSKTGYQFLMRQSYLSPRVWMALDPRETTSPALAGVRSAP